MGADRHQPADLTGVHRGQDRPRAIGADRDRPLGLGPQRADHHVLTAHQVLHGALLPHVAHHQPQPLVRGQGARSAHQRRHLVSGAHRLVHDLSAGPAGRAEHGNFHANQPNLSQWLEYPTIVVCGRRVDCTTVGHCKYSQGVTSTLAADEPLIYEVADLSLALADRTQALVQDVMSEVNLTPALANALWHVGACAPDPPMSELAAKLRRDPSTITFLADRLQERGLLVRDVDPQNRRTKILHLTDAGRMTRRAPRRGHGDPVPDRPPQRPRPAASPRLTRQSHGSAPLSDEKGSIHDERGFGRPAVAASGLSIQPE